MTATSDARKARERARREAEQRRLLRDGLLHDNADLVRLYDTSATFHHAIDQLSAMLPSMVAGLAAAARDADDEAAAIARRMAETPAEPLYLIRRCPPWCQLPKGHDGACVGNP